MTKPLKLPSIQETMSTNVSLSCPANVTLNDYLRCDVTLVGGGSNLQLTIDYGDGSIQVYSPMDPVRIAYGPPVAQNIINSYLYSQTLSTASTYLIANSYFEFDGIVDSFEIYAASAGQIELYVRIKMEKLSFI